MIILRLLLQCSERTEKHGQTDINRKSSFFVIQNFCDEMHSKIFSLAEKETQPCLQCAYFLII